MRAIPVFTITFIASMTILVASDHGYISRVSIVVIALGLAVTGLAVGMLAGWWSWVRRHPVAFTAGSLVTGQNPASSEQAAREVLRLPGPS